MSNRIRVLDPSTAETVIPLNQTALQPLGDKRGWRIFGRTAEPFEIVLEPGESLVMVNERMGAMLEYGTNPIGYDQPVIRERGGGGSVIVPYSIVGREIYIGLVEQNRPLQGGVVLNVPRGMLNAGETHVECARREFNEEVGVSRAFKPEELAGEPVNPNSAYFDTHEQGDGIKFFGFRVPFGVLVPQGEGRFVFDREQVKVSAESKATKAIEQIFGATFMHWSEAALKGDAFTRLGTLAVIVHLRAPEF